MYIVENMVYITDDNWGEIKKFLLFKRDERRGTIHSDNMRDFFHFLEDSIDNCDIDSLNIKKKTNEYNVKLDEICEGPYMYDEYGNYLNDFKDCFDEELDTTIEVIYYDDLDFVIQN